MSGSGPRRPFAASSTLLTLPCPLQVTPRKPVQSGTGVPCAAALHPVAVHQVLPELVVAAHKDESAPQPAVSPKQLNWLAPAPIRGQRARRRNSSLAHRWCGAIRLPRRGRKTLRLSAEHRVSLPGCVRHAALWSTARQLLGEGPRDGWNGGGATPRRGHPSRPLAWNFKSHY